MCGEVLKEQEVIEKLPHTPETVPGKAATCTETGLTDGEKCSVCGEVLKEQEIIPALNHTPEVIPGKAATCTETGLTDGLKCSVCDTVLVVQEVTPALGHTIEVLPGKAAACEEDGLTEGQVCSVCGEVLIAQEVIPATGHSFEDVPGKAPTCEEDGFTESKVCTVCFKVEGLEILPATGHTEQVVPAVPATCEESGKTEGLICSVCGKELIAQEDIPATGHTVEVLPGKAATCEQAGLLEGLVCSVCGKVLMEREVIPALGHDYVKKDPTSLTRTEYECWRCGKQYFTDEKNAILNFYGSILINANGKYVDYVASVDSKDNAGLVITAKITPKAPDWTSEIGLYLTKELIKEIKGDGFKYITYKNDIAALTFTLDDIGDSMFETEEALLQYAFITDPKAADGCLVKVEGITDSSRIPAATFAPMDLVFNGKQIKVNEAGNFKAE